MTKRNRIFLSVTFLLIVVFSGQALTQASGISQFDKKLSESLNINWRSIEYKKTLYKPALTTDNSGWPEEESLTVSFEIKMPDSGLILTTCPDAVIEQITDNRGSNIDFEPLAFGSNFMYGPNRRFMSIGPPSGLHRHTLRVELDAGLLEQIKGEVILKGHFYALVAESLEYVELPFKPSDKWVRLTPDLEIRVREARNEASMYRFYIEERPEMVPRLVDVQIGDYLPSRLVVVRQTITQSRAVGVGGEGSGRGTGAGEKGSGSGRAEKIRYTIAVNPVHQTIPFEIEQIPLSDLYKPVPMQMHGSNHTAHVKRQTQNRTLRGSRSVVQRMSGQVKPQFNKEIADCFEVNWNSINYRKTLYNPAISAKGRDRRMWEKLTVYCEAKILDPNLIIGTCDMPVIEQITVGKSKDADIDRAQSRSDRMYYRTLQYQPSPVPTPPSKLIQLEGKARTTVGLPLRRRHLQKRIPILQPVRMGIQLDPGLLRQDTEEIGSIKGCFYALTAKSSKHVEVPFEPDSKWIRLTSDIEIQVRKAWHSGTAARFDIRQRGRTGPGRHNLNVGDSLPDGIVVERQFIGKNIQPKSPRRFARSLPGQIGGSGRHDSGQRIEKINYHIAVGLNHNKIPFEFQHIPLPKP